VTQSEEFADPKCAEFDDSHGWSRYWIE